MDRHDVPGATAEDVAVAHMSDLEVADHHNVEFFSYWYDHDDSSVFCFARAPSAEAMTAVHEESHGLLPAEIIEVSENEVLGFLGSIHHPADASELTSPFRTIAFTDLVDSTVTLNELGVSEFMVLLTEHDLILRKALVKFGGSEVKHTGDGILASFHEVSHGLRWAVAVREAFDRRDDMDIRVGLAAGEPVEHNDDIFGSSVNLANRLTDAADGGQVLVSELVHDLGIEAGFGFRGPLEKALKGFPTTTPTYELIGQVENR